MGKNKGKGNGQQRSKKSKNVHNRYKEHASINNEYIRYDK